MTALRGAWSTPVRSCAQIPTAPSPEPRIPNRESRIPNRESRIPNPESRMPNPESRIPNPISGRPLLVRRLRRRLRQRGDPLRDLVDRALQLRVGALRELRRILIAGDVRIDAVPFGDPFAARVVHPEGRDGDAAAIDERRRPADADEPAPRAGSN